MTNIDVQVGDVVRLKSGGAKMTVTTIGKEDSAYKPEIICKWFGENENGYEELKTGYFPPEALLKIEEKPK